ncbi:MAG: peptidase MA family metallohydrolase [Chloroflexota bacterium]
MPRLALSLLLILSVVSARRPQPAIRIISQSVESQFPDSLTFSIEVRSDAGAITDAAIYLRVGWDEAERIGLPEAFEAAPQVTLTYVWDTRGETVPPFIEVAYYWHIFDSVGNDLSTTPVQVEYSDHTHNWRSLGNERVIVYWYDQREEFGVALFTAAAEAYDHIASITGITTERPARVVIYNNQRDFCSFYAPNSCEAWVGGQTFPGITVQWGTDVEWLVYDVVPHELAHVFYGEIFEDTWMRVPTWFNEGIAGYNERTDHSREMALVLEAAANADLIPLRLMGTQASGLAHEAIDLWYAEAYSLVAFIAEVHGEGKLGEVILMLADNHPMEEALLQTLGMDLVEFEIGWREWLGYPVDMLPTPLMPGRMVSTPFRLPTVARGGPSGAATATQVVVARATSTPRAAPVQEPSPFPCWAPLGALALGALGLGLVLPRRR